MSNVIMLYTFTREMAEGLAGRKITDEEAIRIRKAIEFSTISECVSEAVFQVCGLADDDDEPESEAEAEAEGCTCCQTRAASSAYECPKCGHLPKSHGGETGEQNLAELLRGNPWERYRRTVE